MIMKRDMNLIRDLLFQIEKGSVEQTSTDLDPPEGISPEEVVYHIEILRGSHLINFSSQSKGINGSIFTELSLTWEGHEFLDSIRSNSVWNTVKKRLKHLGGTATLEIIKELAVKITKTQFFFESCFREAEAILSSLHGESARRLNLTDSKPTVLR